MTDQVPSKEVDLTALMAWLRERHSYLVGLGAKETYEGLVHAHMESLQRTLRGIQSCSTCEACRGAATLALGEVPQPPSAIPFAGVARGVSYEALANATHPERMYGGDAAPEPAPVHGGRIMTLAECVEAEGGIPFVGMEPNTDPLTHQEIFSAVLHHANEIRRLTECVPAECRPAEPPPAEHPNSVNTIGVVRPPGAGL